MKQKRQKPKKQRRQESFQRLPDVMRRTGMGKSTIYKAVRAGTFPPPHKLGARASAWAASSIDAWIEERIQQSVISNGIGD